MLGLLPLRLPPPTRRRVPGWMLWGAGATAWVLGCSRWGYDERLEADPGASLTPTAVLARDNTGCSAGTDCASGACEGDLCVSCADGVQNQDESAIDCGGLACPRCTDSVGCGSPADCSSGVCSGDACQAPSCSDRAQNQGETGTDCGGPCQPCADGVGCREPGDCTSGVCVVLCQTPTCSDSVQNQDETGADCGGNTCGACADGAGCGGPRDCTSGVCGGGVCQAATCSDNVRNQGEADVDCGGSCSACPASGGCSLPGDCASGVCSDSVCQPATCTDGARNQEESGTDCGGSLCEACGPSSGCGTPSDCASGVCSGGVCQAPTCSDGVQNQTEKGTDCGGGTCAGCGTGEACLVPTDCASRLCTANVCQAATCSDAVQNQDETTIDCGGACGTTCNGIRAALVHRYRFDGSGTAVNDTAGSSHGLTRNTTLAGNGTVSLAGGSSEQFVDLPNGVVSALNDASFELWITWRGGNNQRWQRLFDFGATTAQEGTQQVGASYLMLSPQGDDVSNFLLFRYCSDRGPTRDCRNDGLELEARASAPLATGSRKHVVAVFDDTNNVMRIFVDGSQVASRANTRRLSEIRDVNNWLGRSQFDGDPELNGILHELRIYNKALSTPEIQFNTSAGPDPTFL